MTSNDLGLFEAPYLRPGTYRVSVSKEGFKRAVREGVAVRLEDRRVFRQPCPQQAKPSGWD